MIVEELVKTDRREARERYARFVMRAAAFEDTDIEDFLNTKQAVLENRSPLDMIYTGDFERAIAAVDLLLDGLGEES
jgi:hypothetical protein